MFLRLSVNPDWLCTFAIGTLITTSARRRSRITSADFSTRPLRTFTLS